MTRKPPTFRDRRLHGGWTLEKVATFAGINISTLHRIEMNRSRPNRLTERAIEAALAIMETTKKEATGR